MPRSGDRGGGGLLDCRPRGPLGAARRSRRVRRSASSRRELPERAQPDRCGRNDRLRRRPPGMGFSGRERRLRPRLPGQRPRVRRSRAGGDRDDGRQEHGQADDARRRRAARARQRRPALGRRRGAGAGRGRRIPGAAEGRGRRRRARHATGARAGRAGRGLPHRVRRGPGGVRGRRHVPGEGRGRAAPRRDAGAGRRRRRRAGAGRARLLDPAPPSEADRGGPLAGARSRDTVADGGGSGAGVPGLQLRQRRHGRVPAGRRRGGSSSSR